MSKLSYALGYARKGYHVFPCAIDKKPLIKNWQNDASSQPRQINDWWNRTPNASIGIACGLSHLVVIDLDVRNEYSGWDAWNDLCAKLAIDEESTATLQTRTGSGGTHLYFQAAPGVDIRNSASELGRGIDVRGNGGYVIAPPSTHPSGMNYLFVVAKSPLPLPPALVARLIELKYQHSVVASAHTTTPFDPRTADRVMQRVYTDIASAPAGERNVTLARKAWRVFHLVRDGHIDRPSAYQLLIDAGLRSGMAEREVIETVNYAQRKLELVV